MKRILIVLTFALFLPATGRAVEPSLYQRLGGYDAIAAVTDDFLGRLAHDKVLSRFFVGHGTDSIHRIQQEIVEFLCKATGGPCLYTGRDMRAAHAGLGITGTDWQRMLVYLNASFDKFKVPERERHELLAAVAGLKQDIVER